MSQRRRMVQHDLFLRDEDRCLDCKRAPREAGYVACRPCLDKTAARNGCTPFPKIEAKQER